MQACAFGKARRAGFAVFCGFFYLALALAASPGRAGDWRELTTYAPEHPRYLECLHLAQTDPKAGQDRALAWRHESRDGFAARHCLAVAMIGLRDFAGAARQIDALLAAVPPGDLPPDHLLLNGLRRQAGQAWLLADDYPRAAAAFSSILQAMPDDIDARIDRAIAYAEDHRLGEALADLDRALALAPERIEAYVLRAAAHRRIGAIDRARDDLEQALSRQPDNADALFERAMLRWQSGDHDGAWADWRRITQSDAAASLRYAAEENLARLSRPPLGAAGGTTGGDHH